MSIIADWERQEFNKYDRRCCAEDAYNEAVEREIECIEEDISNGAILSALLERRCLIMVRLSAPLMMIHLMMMNL